MTKSRTLLLFILAPLVGLFGALPALAEIDEKVVVCQNHEVLLTARGDIAVVDKSHKVQLYLPIVHENQLIQNDSRALILLGAKKRMGMTLSNQKIQIDYRTGTGLVEDASIGNYQASKKIELKACRRAG